MTVEEARAYLKENWLEGTTCPCCNQTVKLYKRKLTYGMIKPLIKLYRATNGDTRKLVHRSKLGHINGGEFAQLKKWYLIDDEPYEGTEKRRSGNWRITDSGVRFVKKQIKIPGYRYTYNGKEKSVPGGVRDIDITEAIGNKFNYAEMMGENRSHYENNQTLL